ncbi:hypothetical protein [Natronorubrum thiooxidans]|uniref:Uncharacterized protein n=1 Tax=Natronorubrum thiooxidans TaxID=308853 RepID=A0A1N7GVV1_9EURY|nr:hypothetical protein [Natronorubrum thiooxidans]SIS16670.1 hypothetical protein SAMN05421752_11623 [Natronorubrum thiooxidans]
MSVKTPTTVGVAQLSNESRDVVAELEAEIDRYVEQISVVEQDGRLFASAEMSPTNSGSDSRSLRKKARNLGWVHDPGKISYDTVNLVYDEGSDPHLDSTIPMSTRSSSRFARECPTDPLQIGARVQVSLPQGETSFGEESQRHGRLASVADLDAGDEVVVEHRATRTHGGYQYSSCNEKLWTEVSSVSSETVELEDGTHFDLTTTYEGEAVWMDGGETHAVKHVTVLDE